MTRETKIGLLVGLAFIIVIGILLSDHLTSSTEPPPATLANAGSNVMQTINTPGSTAAAQAQPLTPPQHVQPNQTVPTAADLTPQPQPVQIVQVGPGTNAQPQPITIQAQEPPQQPQRAPTDQPNGTGMAPVVMTPENQTPVASVNENSIHDAPIITHVPAPSPVNNSLAQAAQRNGESLVALDSSGRATGSNPPTWTQALTGMKEYQAQPGDSVSRMASRFLGGNTKANRDLIIRANPSLQKDPNKVIVGQSYLIPSAGESTAVATMQTQPQAAPVPTVTVPAESTVVASATEYWYTVKEGDSLWKIASEQLGDANARTAIKELNKISDENRIYAGMKLRLPGKPIAQAH